MSVRAAALALILLVPLAASAPLPPLGVCTQYGCAHVRDTDGDGTYDWANAASSVDHAATLNANYHALVLVAQVDGGTEETLEPYHAAVVLVYVDAGGRDAFVFGHAYEGDEETGETTPVASQLVRVRDLDGDGVPEVEATPALP